MPRSPSIEGTQNKPTFKSPPVNYPNVSSKNRSAQLSVWDLQYPLKTSKNPWPKNHSFHQTPKPKRPTQTQQLNMPDRGSIVLSWVTFSGQGKLGSLARDFPLPRVLGPRDDLL